MYYDIRKSKKIIIIMLPRLKSITYHSTSFILRLKTKVFDRLKGIKKYFISDNNKDLEINNNKSRKLTPVPKVLFTSYCCSEEDIIIQQIISKWKSLNPDFKVIYFSDNDVYDFFKKDSNYFEIFSKLKNGVVKADFFRICYLNKFGGYWFDIDLEPFKVTVPVNGKIHLFDCGYGNISYMFIGGTANKLFQETIKEVSQRISYNLEKKLSSVLDISGPRVIQNLLSKKLGFKLKDQSFIGRRVVKTYLVGSDYEFEYTRQNNGRVKSFLYRKLQEKYNKLPYDKYDYI